MQGRSTVQSTIGRAKIKYIVFTLGVIFFLYILNNQTSQPKKIYSVHIKY